MCCFSRPVESVTNTNIFARGRTNGDQYLVYGMKLSAAEDLAMILPLPVPKDTRDDAVRFISLKEYPRFFIDMQSGFPEPRTMSLPAGGPGGTFGGKPKLAVVEVGAFEASFVPSIADFSRLDERFRLPAYVWSKLPLYSKYRFAVFKLKSGDREIHPVAFEFPRANPRELFFPTVHIHDGEVHAKAEFDHSLYCQAGGGTGRFPGWKESAQPAGFFLKTANCQGLVYGDFHVFRRRISGLAKNEDVML